MRTTALTAAAAGLLSTAASAAMNVTLLSHIHNSKVWFGDTAIALSPDPKLLLSTWVYGPAEIVAYKETGQELWHTNVSKEFKYQTLYVASAKPAYSAPAGGSPSVDTLLLWGRKPAPMVGPLTLYGINSAVKPNLDTGEGVVWSTNLSTSSENINGWVPQTWLDLSDDGSLAVSWLHDGLGNCTIFAHDAQTGKQRWATNIVYNQSVADFVYEYGVSCSANGEWVAYDQGIAGTTNQTITIVDAATGVPRGPPVQSVGLINTRLSHDGAYTYTQTDTYGPHATVQRWDAGSGTYVPVGDIIGPLPGGDISGGWYLVGADFGFDASTGTTTFGALWLTASLNGATSFGVWNVSNLAAGPVANYSLDSNDSGFATSSGEVSCAGLLCAAAMMTTVQNGTTPTIAVLSAAGAGDAWTYVSPGTMLSVDVNVDPATGTYYVGASGCDTHSVCTKAGADAYLFSVTGVPT